MHQLLATTGVVLAGIVSLALAQSESPDDRYNEPTARYMIALGIDGSLEGWAGYVEASSGQFHGAPGALVYLVRAGELIEKVEANANGYFRVVAAVPGVYSVTAIDERGFSASAIQVVAAGEEAAYSSVLCTMIPHADFDVVGRLEDALAAVEAHDVEAKSCCDDTGPTGGRGGGLGGMLGFGIGAAGLAAGIAALNDLNQDRRQTSASPESEVLWGVREGFAGKGKTPTPSAALEQHQSFHSTDVKACRFFSGLARQVSSVNRLAYALCLF